MKRAVIYARVSRMRDADENVSVPSQIDNCRTKAEALECEVVQVFRDDGISGRSDDRPGFQAALAYCAAHSVDYFVTWSTARFARNLEERLKNTSALMRYGTKTVFVTQDINPETDEGWMMGVMTGMFDELMSRNVAKDTLRSMISSSREGFFVGGRAPFGYQVVKDGKRSRLAVDDAQAVIVRKMFEMALLESLGAQAIAIRLNAAGLKRGEKGWGKNSVSLILKNPSYKGERQFNRFNRRRRVLNAEEAIIKIPSHPAIIPADDFDKVQTMMKARTPHEVGGTPKSCFAFTGLLRCGVCNSQLQITNGTGRSGITYSYYSCLAHKVGASRCLLKNVPAEGFDAWMVDELLDKVLTTSVVEKVIAEVRAGSGKWAEERSQRRKAMVRELREAERKRENIYETIESLGRNAIGVSELMERLAMHRESVNTLTRAIDELETSQAPDYDLVDLDPKVAVEAIGEVIRACPDPKQLRMLLATFVAKITVANATVTVEYREDALLRSPCPTVHSGGKWLPNQHCLRTKKIEISRPLAFPAIRLAA